VTSTFALDYAPLLVTSTFAFDYATFAFGVCKQRQKAKAKDAKAKDAKAKDATFAPFAFALHTPKAKGSLTTFAPFAFASIRQKQRVALQRQERQPLLLATAGRP
jgi:hypothetical protein